ncbi:hypothetical protein [Wolbachia endosymbiont of Nomada panzeri]|uniref:hypothetical protein n=1 Tax=Wolbachia endosymbiont of Nomada panzeri TaxID=1854760 RepID=UPI0012E83185|nr:hypothetical protein [Wolbachia endosymbiont of Nomada panzeri]
MLATWMTKKTGSQCLGTGMTPMGIWYDIKKHECHSASFFVIPAGDAGIQTVHWV